MGLNFTSNFLVPKANLAIASFWILAHISALAISCVWVCARVFDCVHMCGWEGGCVVQIEETAVVVITEWSDLICLACLL